MPLGTATAATVVASAAAGAVVGGLLVARMELGRAAPPVAPTGGSADGSTDTSSAHPALRYGQPQTHAWVETPAFVASGDYRTRNPAYVIEHLTPSSLRSGGGGG
eukprot:CAMPEP_0119493356 /NCGR_PEP_ID=MMETSP1344-20130328/17635_1 /TAXON_ID=236787 /ORGANISM="Florenciella parvula, Strain CCMP2471" /LENGTH=104 /DNA_ID=CAMNT_0007528775 /DNA_START=151 /DNA_END=461 /DNA_ORIENTATION=-